MKISRSLVLTTAAAIGAVCIGCSAGPQTQVAPGAEAVSSSEGAPTGEPSAVQSVEDLFAKTAELGGKTVTIKGKVVKFSAGIMGKNWIHIQDGSGGPGTNDITVTTDAVVAVESTATVTGTLSTNKDFGYGYKYAVIIEDAVVSTD